MYGYAQETGKNFIDQNFIEVTGFAERQISPDRIYLHLLLNEKDFKGKTLNEVEKTMITTLLEIGIDVSKNLAIKDFISKFRNYWILIWKFCRCRNTNCWYLMHKPQKKYIEDLKKSEFLTFR